MKRIIAGLLALGLLMVIPVAVLAEWKIDLNHPDLSLYERGDEAWAELSWSGNDPQPTVPEFALFDHEGKSLQKLTAVKNGDAWKIALPTNRLGYYEVRATGANSAQVIPELGSRPAGRLTWSVVEKINPNPSNDFTSSFLSAQGTTILQKSGPKANFGWDAYPYLGVQSWGVGYHWGHLEADGPGTFEKNIAKDPNPQWIRELKVVPYFHLNGTPMWAVDISRLPEKERSGRSTQRVPPKDWAAWEAFLEKLIPYLVKSYDFLPERVYEVMWEPMIPWGWYGTPEEIVKTFEIAHKVVRKHDPKGKIAGPTLSGLNDREYYEKLLKAGLGRYLDIVSFHPYKGYPPESSNIAESLQAIRAVNIQYMGRDVPFMGTEYGYPQGVTGSALNQGYGLAASILIFKGEKATKQTLFYLADYAGEPGYGMNYNLVPKLPFGPSKISPKPAVALVRAAADQVARAESIGKLDYLGSGIWGYVYQDKSSRTILAAIWDATDQNRSIVFDAGQPKVDVVDQFGNHEQRTTEDGRLTLKLGRGATYVRGLSESLYGAGRITSMLNTEAVWKLYRGHPSVQTVGLNRLAEESDLKLTFDTISDIYSGRVQASFSKATPKKTEVRFDVAANAPLGRAPGYIRISSNGKRLYSGIQPLEVMPELEIGAIRTAFQSTQWVATVTAKNVSPFDWVGKALLKIENNAAPEQVLSLAPGVEKKITFPVDVQSAPRNYQATVDFKASNATALQQKGLLTFYVIRKRPSESDFWKSMPETKLVTTSESIWRISHGTEFRGNSDLSASISYAYDENNVYVKVDVLDDVHRQEAPEGSTWSQDSLQLGFDVAPERESNSNLLAETNARTNSEWTFAWTPRGGEIYLNTAPGGTVVPQDGLVRFPGVSLSGGRSNGHTHYLITMPWKLLDPKGQRSPSQLKVAAAINDSDGATVPSDRRALEFFGGIVSKKETAFYGTAFLEGK